MKLSEAVNKVIELAQKVFGYYDRELPKWHPNYPLVNPDDKEPPPPPEEKELKDFLMSLSEDMIDQVLLLTYLGREGVGIADLAESYEDLKGSFGGPEQVAAFLMHYAPLADDLLDALEELRKHKISVDRLPLKKVKVRKP